MPDRDDAGDGHLPTVLICGTMPWRGTTILDHHVAREFTRYGRVLYVDRPTSVLTRLRNPAGAAAAAGPWLEQVAERLFVVRPRVNPLMERPVGKRLGLALVRRTMRRAVRALGGPEVDVVVVPSLNPLFGAVGERRTVYYASDDHQAGASLMGVSESLLRGQTERQVRQADVVVAVSPPLRDRLARFGKPVLLIPNGVETEHFAAAAMPDPALAGMIAAHLPGRSVVGVLGHLGDRIDPELVRAVTRAGYGVVMVGPVQRTASDRFAALLDADGVLWAGPRAYADLPEVLACADVWLLPYTDSEFNRASFPLKVLEYLAAGRRVVATDLPAVRWLDTDLVATGGDPSSFVGAVDASFAAPLTEEEQTERRRFAARHSWRERIDVLARELGLVPIPAPAPRSADQPTLNS